MTPLHPSVLFLVVVGKFGREDEGAGVNELHVVSLALFDLVGG